MTRLTRTLGIALCAMAVTTTACGSDKPETNSFPGEGSPGGAAPTGTAASELPSPTFASPTGTASGSAPPTSAGGGGGLSGGSAHVELSGGLSASFDLPFVAGQSQFNQGAGTALVWSDASGKALSFGGLVEPGETTTSETFVLTVAYVEGADYAALVSAKGECTVKFDSASSSGISGSFECTDVPSGQETLDATGTFEAGA